MVLDIIKMGVKAIGSVVGGDFGNKAKDVAEALDGEIGQRPEVLAAMQRHELEIKKLVLADAEGARQLIREEARSEDPFVRRARPAFLWLFYVVVVVNFGVLPTLMILGLIEGPITYPALPEELYWLFGTAFLGYTGFRSFDKFKKKRP